MRSDSSFRFPPSGVTLPVRFTTVAAGTGVRTGSGTGAGVSVGVGVGAAAGAGLATGGLRSTWIAPRPSGETAHGTSADARVPPGAVDISTRPSSDSSP